jgi:hypothetical protein
MITFSLKSSLLTLIFVSLFFVSCRSVESGASSATPTFSSLDFTEIESFHYDIKIDGNPLLEQTLASQVMVSQILCDARLLFSDMTLGIKTLSVTGLISSL